MWVLIIWLLSVLWGAPACLSWARTKHWVKNPKLFLIILWFHWPYFSSRNTLCFFFFFFFQDSAINVSSPWNVLLPEYCEVVTSYHSIIISNVTSELCLTHGLISLQNYLTDFVSVNKYFLSGIFPTDIVPCFQNTKRK